MTPAPISVERLRELLDKATELPWRCTDGPVGYQHRVSSDGADGETVCDVERTSADAALIVAAVNALPALLQQLAERDAEVEMLRGVIAWVGEVYPATDAEADGAHMTVTWAQFNAMREAVGLKPAKAATQAKNKSLIVRADHLRSLEAAERARDEACGLLRESIGEIRDAATDARVANLPNRGAHLDKLAVRIAAFLAASGGDRP